MKEWKIVLIHFCLFHRRMQSILTLQDLTDRKQAGLIYVQPNVDLFSDQAMWLKGFDKLHCN